MNFPDFPVSVTRHHVVYMLLKIESGEIAGEQGHRWLGWAQCAAVSANCATIEDVKKINHEA